MLKRMLPACLLAAALVTANGCCSTHPMICHGSAVPESYGAGDCGGCGACDSCGAGAYRERHQGHGLKGCLTCGSGCGEMYWGDWLNHPPTYYDGCDSCGNWTGPGYNPCFGHWPLLSGLRNLWGYRYRGGVLGWDGYEGGYEGGCESCGAGHSEGLPTETIRQPSGEHFTPPTPEPEAAPPRKATETAHRVRQATYTRPPLKNAARAPRPKVQTAPRPVRPKPVVQDEEVSQDITR